MYGIAVWLHVKWFTTITPCDIPLLMQQVLNVAGNKVGSSMPTSYAGLLQLQVLNASSNVLQGRGMHGVGCGAALYVSQCLK